MMSAKIKKNIIRLPIFLFPEGTLNQNQSFCFYIYYSFVERLFKMKRKTLVTKYMDTSTLARTVSPKWNIIFFTGHLLSQTCYLSLYYYVNYKLT